MSATEAAADEICASCGIAGDDDIKLKNCTACKLVKYCGVECQRNHRSQHKRACKKRAAELKDELLFKQSESTHLGDCPICLLPIPIAISEETLAYSIYSCCSKVVCTGCGVANALRQIEERLPSRCPFCRSLAQSTDEKIDLNKTMKRVKVNDPLALHNMGMTSFDAGDYATALEYLEKAAELGHIESHFELSIAYDDGRGAERDIKKATYHAEQAAIGGHPNARHNLGMWEQYNGSMERAVKHFIIAANLGYDDSLQKLKEYYTQGVVSKADFAAALRAYQAALDATRSPQRDAAAANLPQWKKQAAQWKKVQRDAEQTFRKMV